MSDKQKAVDSVPLPRPRALSRRKVGLGKAAALSSLPALRLLSTVIQQDAQQAAGSTAGVRGTVTEKLVLSGRLRIPPGTAVVWLHPSSAFRVFRSPRLRKSKHGTEPPGLAGISAETPSFPATCERRCSDPEMPNDPCCPGGRPDPAGAEPRALCSWQHPPCAPRCQL